MLHHSDRFSPPPVNPAPVAKFNQMHPTNGTSSVTSLPPVPVKPTAKVVTFSDAMNKDNVKVRCLL